VDTLLAAVGAAHEAVDADRVSTFLKIDDKRASDEPASEGRGGRARTRPRGALGRRLTGLDGSGGLRNLLCGGAEPADMDSLNRMSLELADEALEFTEELDVGAFELDNGTTVIDFGVEHVGGLEAGLLLTELQTAGLATVQTRVDEVAGATFPHVELACDQPGVALLGAQKAGWEVSTDDYEGLGSGPARAGRPGGRVPRARLRRRLRVRRARPRERRAAHRGRRRAGRGPRGREHRERLPRGLPDGERRGQRDGRRARRGTRRLQALRTRLRPDGRAHGQRERAVAPVAADEEAAIGRTNDALAYGGRVHLTVAEDFDEFGAVPSSAAERYGVPFADIFADADWNADDVDEGVFGPAQVTVDVIGGPTYTLGDVHEDLLADGFGIA